MGGADGPFVVGNRPGEQPLAASGQRTHEMFALGYIYTDDNVSSELRAILHLQIPFSELYETLLTGTGASTTLRTSLTTSVHVPLRDHRHPTTAGDITPQATGCRRARSVPGRQESTYR